MVTPRECSKVITSATPQLTSKGGNRCWSTILLVALCFSLSVLRAPGETVTATIPAGIAPRAVAVNPVTNKVYVANYGGQYGPGGSLTVIDEAKNATETIPIGGRPFDVAVNPVTNKIYVTNNMDPGSVTVIDGATNAFTDVSTGALPEGLAVNPVTNKIYVASNTNPGSVTVIDGATNATTTVEAGIYPVAVAVNSVTNKVYVLGGDYYTNTGNFTVIDGATNVATPINAGIAPDPLKVAVNPVTNKVYVLSGYLSCCNLPIVTVIDGVTNAAKTITTAAGADMVVNPVTNKIYVADNSGHVLVIDGATNGTTISAAAQANLLAVNPVTNQIYAVGSSSVTVIDAAGAILAALKAGNTPSAIAINPVTNRIYVANIGGNDVTIIDGAINSPFTVAVDWRPSAVAVNPVTNKVYVGNGTVPGTVSVIDGATNDITATVTVGYGIADIEVNPVTNQIYVANGNGASNNVTVIDGTSNSTATVSTGIGPVALAVNPVTNKIYVANFTGNSVTVIDGATNATATITAGTEPGALAVNPATNKIYVANFTGNNVTVIDGASNATTTISTGRGPTAVVVNPATNKIYVTNVNSNNVTIIDGVTNATSTVITGAEPQFIALNPVTNKIYVSNYSGTVTVIDGDTNLVTSTINVSSEPLFLKVNPVSNKIYLLSRSSTNVTVIDGGTGTTTTVAAGSEPFGLAINPVTNKIYVPNNLANNVTVIYEQYVNPIPLQASITPQTDNEVTSTTATFHFTAASTFSPIAPPPNALYYQLDTWQGSWQPATSDGSNAFTGSVSGLIPGLHILYAYSTDGQDATSTMTGSNSNPLTSNVVAYPFLVKFVPITIQTSPSGPSFNVDGTVYSSSQTFDWVPGDTHMVSFATTQTGTGAQYQFTGWADGTTSDPRTITVPSSPTAYIADFAAQYQVTTAVFPVNAGTVMLPVSGSYLNAGTPQPLAVTPAPSFYFVNWTATANGTVYNSYSATAATVTLSGPATVTANFTTSPNIPSVVSTTPNSAAGVSQTFTLIYSDTGGAASLNYVEVLFNSAIDGANTCLAYYYPASGLLKMVNDAGTASIPGQITIRNGQTSDQTMSNSQCIIGGTHTTVVESGNTLTLKLDVTASDDFQGKHFIYMAAIDNSGRRTGWVNEGTWIPGGNQSPRVLAVTPNQATGLNSNFLLQYSDGNGNTDLRWVAVLINSTESGVNACYAYYYPATNSLYLENDAGNGSTGPITPGSGTLSNGQCTIDGNGSSVMRSGNTLWLNLAVIASSTFTSQSNIYMRAVDNSEASTNWLQAGTWTP